MTESSNQDDQTHRPPRRQSLLAILKRTFKLYARHWRPMTVCLLSPMLQILIGLYGCLLVGQGYINTILDCCQPFVADHPWLVLGLLGVIVLLFMALMLRGTWHYLIYWASLCLTAWDADQDMPVEPTTAYQSILNNKGFAYKILVSTYFLLPIATLIPVSVLPYMGQFLGTGIMELLLLAGMIQSIFLVGLWIVTMIFMSYIFQVAAFENSIPLNPVHTIIASAKIATKRFWTTLGMQAILLVATNLLFNAPIVMLLRFVNLTLPLDRLHQTIMEMSLQGLPTDPGDPLYQEAFLAIQRYAPMLAQNLTDLTIMLLITMLLLPLGSIAFTLLYKDILKCDRNKAPFSL